MSSASLTDSILNICQNCYTDFLSLKNVNGIALGLKSTNSQITGELCLQVLVEQKMSILKLDSKDVVPKTYQNIKTDVVEVGKLFTKSLNTKIRPAKCGYSLGPVNSLHYGTAGCIVKRGSDLNIEYFILSCNHILANINSLPLGTPILQPAQLDGGKNPDDIIANLSEFVTLKFSSRSVRLPNLVDCAIAKIKNDSLISNELAWIGYPKGIADAALGSRVKKCGRTTGLTDGLVKSIGATIWLLLHNGRFSLLQDQILTDNISSLGDSGSLVLDADNNAIGLLCGGSRSVSICNKINNVLSALNVELV